MKFSDNIIATSDIKYPQLCKNKDGVYNICHNEEDMLKSNQWFGNLPIRMNVYTNEGKLIPVNSKKLHWLIVSNQINIDEEYDEERIINLWLNSL